MQVQITTANKSQNSFFFEATCGKKSASVFIGDSYINVVCKNASHRAWGGMGKCFETIEQAIGAYKSNEMKTIIKSAAEMKFAAA